MTATGKSMIEQRHIREPGIPGETLACLRPGDADDRHCASADTRAQRNYRVLLNLGIRGAASLCLLSCCPDVQAGAAAGAACT